MPERKPEPPIRPEDLRLSTLDGKPLEVSPEGSLGLLALGYKGLMAWRAARRAKPPTSPTAQKP
ncbi:MAG: hypothetical protein WAU70_07555 [Flavobacteriales bacterium]